jgi:hypothetical protein
MKIEEIEIQVREMKHDYEKYSKLNDIKFDKSIFENDLIKNQINNIENSKITLQDQVVSLTSSCSSFKNDI